MSEKDSVVINLRACVISAPTGVSADDVNKEYKSLVGENIPYKRLGYSSLEEFLTSIPDFDVVNKAGQWFVQAKASEESSHISQLVRGQNKPKKKSRGGFKMRGSGARFNTAPRSNNFRPRQVPHFMPSPKPSPTTAHKAPAQRMPPLLSTPSRRPLLPTPSRPPLLPTPSIPPLLPTPSIPPHNSQTATLPPQPKPLMSGAPSMTKQPPPPAKPPQKTSIANNRLLTSQKDETSKTDPTYQANQEKSTAVPIKWVDPIAWNKKNASSNASIPVLDTPDHPTLQCDKSTFVLKLTRYATDHNWPKPEFFVLSRRIGTSKNSRNAKNLYMCRVCVHSYPIGTKPKDGTLSTHEFSSYPEEFPEVSAAIEHVANIAYNGLISKDSIQLPETKDVRLLLQRIDELVKGQDEGIWLYQIEKIYREKYNENIPQALPSYLHGSETVELTKLAESYYILRPKTDELKNKTTNTNNNLSIKPITLPDDEYWEVFVARVKTLNEIYIRIISDTISVPFDKMCDEMDAYYKDSEADALEHVELGRYYALRASDGSFHRVLVTGFSGSRYQIYLIDVGDVEVVDSSELRDLQPKFYSVPAQAIPCFLEHMDSLSFDLTDPAITDAVYQLVLGKSFGAYVTVRSPLQIVLLEASNDEGDDVQVNLLLREMILKSFKPPKVTEEGTLLLVNITFISIDGQVWIQIPSWTLTCLNDKLSFINNGYYELNHLKELEQISMNKLYLYLNTPTRVKVLEFVDSDNVLVECLDIGGSLQVPLREIFEIPEQDEVLSTIPPQAIKVLMAHVTDGILTPSQAANCFSMVNSNSNLTIIAKVSSFFGGTPVIEIFVRDEKTNMLVSVNQNLSFDDVSSITPAASIAPSNYSNVDDTFSGWRSVVTNSQDLSSSGRPTGSVLSHGLALPRINDFLDIFVTGVANPMNFTITPVKYFDALNELGNELIAYYTTNALRSEEYKPQIGEVVAAFQSGFWLRVYVEKKIDSFNYACRLLDRGHMNAFPSKALRKLPEKFQKYPYLAFKAQLHGIKPLNSDWEVEDCVRIRDMLKNKKLCSVVKDIIIEEDRKKLSLEIIDTSTAVDIYIAHQLMLEGRALPNN